MRARPRKKNGPESDSWYFTKIHREFAQEIACIHSIRVPHLVEERHGQYVVSRNYLK